MEYPLKKNVISLMISYVQCTQPFIMEYRQKIICEAQIIIICQAYERFFYGILFKNNLWSTNHLRTISSPPLQFLSFLVRILMAGDFKKANAGTPIISTVVRKSTNIVVFAWKSVFYLMFFSEEWAKFSSKS